MNILKQIIESTQMKIIAAFSTILGLGFNIFRVFGINDNTITTVLGAILFIFGFIFICAYLFLQRNEICKMREDIKKINYENVSLKHTIDSTNKKYGGLLEIAYHGIHTILLQYILIAKMKNIGFNLKNILLESLI